MQAEPIAQQLAVPLARYGASLLPKKPRKPRVESSFAPPQSAEDAPVRPDDSVSVA